MLVVAALLALVATEAARAQGAAGEQEFLRERIESLRRDPPGTIEGASIAAVTLLEQMYERREFRRAWSEPGKPGQLLAAIRASEADGLNPEDYHLAALEAMRDRIAAASPAPASLLVDYDLLLTDALARLGYHILFGKVDFSRFDPDWNYQREIHGLDPPVGIQKVIDEPDVAAAIEREKPAHVAYTLLKAELARLRRIRDAGGWERVKEGPAIRPGNPDARIPAIRARLTATGDLAREAAAGESAAYDSVLARAVREFQSRHGLEADATIGTSTIREMNVPVEARINQLRVNLERGRWLLHDIGRSFVIVNVAGFRLYYVEEGRPAWTTRVQVGKPYRKTPVFRSRITYLVLNPTWTVPPGILANDILPSQKRDPGTLARKKLKVVDAKGNEIDPATIDWSRATPRNFPYYLRQDPGPDNALGRVKFMFPNDHAVYLHDTPSRALFEKEERAFSSGCIRVEDPLQLAELLLAGEKGWSRAAIDAAVKDGRTRSVSLSAPVPVLLSYWTAWVEDDRLQFRNDLYGRDEQVLAGLDEPFRLRRRT